MVEMHPGLILLAAALVVSAVGRRLAAPVGVGAAAIAVLAASGLSEGTVWHHDFYGIEVIPLRADSLALPFAIVFTVVALLAMIYGWATMNPTEIAAALATAGAGIGVVLAGDLLTLFMFWELKVITVVVLIAARGRAASSAAATRYLRVHLVAGVVLLGGVIWWAVRTGSLVFDEISLSGPGWLILIGFAVCAAVVPLHAWLADAYPTASIAATVVLSAYTTKSAVYALARGFSGVELLVWVGVAMAVVGVVFAILEDDIRRLLSYHIVSQVGFMVTAIGIGTAAAINGATAHATAHVLYKALLLMGAGAVVYATGRSRTSQLGGLSRAMPMVVVLYLVGALSISGVAGFSGFPAKELAVASVGGGDITGATAAQWLLKFASVGTFASVALKLPALTFFGAARGPAPARQIPITMYAAMGAGAVANVAIGVRPRLLLDRLPTTEAFNAYTSAKVIESTALLAATMLGVWLMRSRLVPKAITNLDTDVVYRELPMALAPRLRRLAADIGRPDRIRRPQIHTADLGALAPERLAPGPVAPGWLLGATIAGTMVLVLGTAVVMR